MKGSLIILSFFATGILLGVFRFLPLDFLNHNITFYVLCGLMFSVGISIGNDPTSFQQFRNLNPRLIFLPLMTILG
ncbi:MAG: LysO family transporter, partial [Bacteroidota bacterium]|nr:LysO family transporter [Bacteroidota bacterium]